MACCGSLPGRPCCVSTAPTRPAWPPGHVQHYYCPHCGAHPFSRGYLEKEMGGHFWAANVACLDDVGEEALAAAPVIYEDGRR